MKTSVVDATNDVVHIAVGTVIVRFDSVIVTSGMSGQDLEQTARAAVERVRSKG